MDVFLKEKFFEIIKEDVESDFEFIRLMNDLPEFSSDANSFMLEVQKKFKNKEIIDFKNYIEFYESFFGKNESKKQSKNRKEKQMQNDEPKEQEKEYEKKKGEKQSKSCKIGNEYQQNKSENVEEKEKEEKKSKSNKISNEYQKDKTENDEDKQNEKKKGEKKSKGNKTQTDKSKNDEPNEMEKAEKKSKRQKLGNEPNKDKSENDEPNEKEKVCEGEKKSKRKKSSNDPPKDESNEHSKKYEKHPNELKNKEKKIDVLKQKGNNNFEQQKEEEKHEKQRRSKENLPKVLERSIIHSDSEILEKNEKDKLKNKQANYSKNEQQDNLKYENLLMKDFIELKQNPIPLYSPPPLQKEVLIENGIFCSIEHKDIEIKELMKYIPSFLNTFTNRKLALPDETQLKFNLVNEINVRDELGEWKYEPLQGCMSINLNFEKEGENVCFPRSFIIPKDYFNREKTIRLMKMKEKVEMQEKHEDYTLQEFLKMVIKQNNKDPWNLKEWNDKFRAQYIERVDELVDWEDSDWEKCNLEPNIKRLIRKELAKFKFKAYSNVATELSESEKIAILHRIKRFFLHSIDPEELKKIEYLDSRAVKLGFEEIRKDYVGEYLLKQLEGFYYTFSIAKSYSKNLEYSRGMLLYGPPGTGKTTLTDKLPSIIGLTPISYPLCAAEVNRSLVGQTEKLLLELFARARKVPYLLCAISIDEIDGLAPKRDEKSSQHKGDVLAVLLSLIGGIKDVKNIVVLASTNRLNMMDEAFRRRMSGQFFVGRPSPEARRIMLNRADKTFLDKEMVEQAVMITSNFSGAALKMFISDVICEAKMNARELLYEEIAEIAKRNSNRFNIKLGNYSLPELFSLHRSNESILNLKFLESIEEKVGLITFERQMVFVSHIRSRKQCLDSQMPKSIEIVKKLVFLEKNCNDFYSLFTYFNQKLNGNKRIKAEKLTLMEVDNLKNESHIQFYLKSKIREITNLSTETKNTLILVFWDEVFGDNQNKISSSTEKIIQEFLSQPKDNVINLLAISSAVSFKRIKNLLNWSKHKEYVKEELAFTGRIMVDLSDETQEIRYELEKNQHSLKEEYRLLCEPLFLKKRAWSSRDIIPALAEFASKRGIDFILLMDQDFLLSNNAFDETKVKENINEKMQEFNNYEKSMLIIDFDSLVGVSRSVSSSNMGPSTSFSVSDPRIYNLILHYATALPQISEKAEYWVAVIVKNAESARFVNKDMHFPKTEKYMEDEEKEEEKKLERKCLRCSKNYTEEKNEIDSCSYHINLLMQSRPADSVILSLEKVNNKIFSNNMREEGKQIKDLQFVYLCCNNQLNSQGCRSGRHSDDKRNVEFELEKNFKEYDKKIQELRKKF